MRICMLNITSGDMCWGYRNYLACLVPRLAAHPEVEALLVGLPQTVDVSNWQRESPSVKWLPLRCSLAARGREISQSARRVIEGFAPDVVFIPTARHWALDGVPVVTMVRNMMPATRTYAGHWLDRIRNRARLVQIRSTVGKSSRVIAVSRFVKTYLANDLGVPESRIGVVYHGTDLMRDRPLQRPAGVPENWQDRFVFTAGSIYPYRGLDDLILAWDCLGASKVRPALLIGGFIGRGMKRYHEHLARLIRERNLDAHIRFLGALSRAEMNWCYGNCSAFVTTSRVEACPNIVLEAMASGCLCISTDNPPMPEIFADAASYYRAGEPRMLAARIAEVLALSGDEQQSARSRALDRASGFTWELCCSRTVAELQKAIHG